MKNNKRYVFIETLGCSKNQVDSEIMMGLFQDHAYYMTSEVDKADIIVVNTCGFIESAKEESIQTILDMTSYKQAGTCKYLLVTGCLAERYANELLKELPEVDAFVGTTAFDAITAIVTQLENQGETIQQTGNIDKVFSENLPRRLSTPSHYAFLKIAEGCDNVCTYCIIPKLRGKYRSRPIEAIVSEAKNLVAQGVKELIVIAQDTTRYGVDLYGAYKLGELLEALNAIEDLKWIRLQYMYPDIVDEDLIMTIARLDKVVKYLDIPVQHASDSILKRMARHTTRQDILNLVTMARKHMPQVTLRTTVIVGFPGETDEDFQTLLDFVEICRFDRLGAFKYSKEEDTPAYLLDGHIDEDMKQERYEKLMFLQQEISEELMSLRIGQTLEVVIEELTDDPTIFIGRTGQDAPEVDGLCYVKSTKPLEVGTFVLVKINDAMEFDIMGECL